MLSPSLRVVLDSRLLWLEVVQSLGEDLAAAVGFDEDERFAIGMALREALNNAMLHGNRRDPDRTVEVGFRILADRLEVRVKDQGPGFDPGKLPDPLAEPNLLKASGRGVFLMRNYMDEVDLARAREPGGEIRMVKLKKAPEPAAERG